MSLRCSAHHTPSRTGRRSSNPLEFPWVILDCMVDVISTYQLLSTFFFKIYIDIQRAASHWLWPWRKTQHWPPSLVQPQLKVWSKWLALVSLMTRGRGHVQIRSDQSKTCFRKLVRYIGVWSEPMCVKSYLAKMRKNANSPRNRLDESFQQWTLVQRGMSKDMEIGMQYMLPTAWKLSWSGRKKSITRVSTVSLSKKIVLWSAHSITRMLKEKHSSMSPKI